MGRDTLAVLDYAGLEVDEDEPEQTTVEGDRPGHHAEARRYQRAADYAALLAAYAEPECDVLAYLRD